MSQNFRRLYQSLVQSISWLQLPGPPDASDGNFEEISEFSKFNDLWSKPSDLVLNPAKLDWISEFGREMKIMVEEGNGSIIQLNRLNTEDDDLLYWIEFWQFQFKEHLAYLNLLLARLPDVAFTSESPLISDLKANQPQISSRVLESLEKSANIVERLKELTLELVKAWNQFQQEILLPQQADEKVKIPISQLYILTEWTLMVKFQTWMLQTRGFWLGNAWTGELQHYIEELIAFCMRLSNNFSAIQELSYLTNMISDHMGLIGHTITPGGPENIRDVVADNLGMSEEGSKLIQGVISKYKDEEEETTESEEKLSFYIKETSDYFSSEMNQLLSQEIPNISIPVDIVHMQREHMFATKMLNEYEYVDQK